METYKKPAEGWNLLFCFGIVHFAKSFSYKIEEVGRQLMYCYYREQEIIPNDLLDKIQSYVDSDKLKIDAGYCGFSGGSFDPLEYSDELLGLFDSDVDFKEESILLYQIRQAISIKFLYIDLVSIDTCIRSYQRGVNLKDAFESKFGNDVMVGVKVEHIFSFRDSGKDWDLFRAYIGIKSMIGQKSFTISNKPGILSRMVGCKSKAAFEYFTTNQKDMVKGLLPTVQKFNKRYQMDKLLLTLAERKYIMYLSKVKVSKIYLSVFMEPHELAKLVADWKTGKNLKQRIKDAAASL